MSKMQGKFQSRAGLRKLAGATPAGVQWPNPVVWKNREGEIKISPGVTKGTFYFPQEWLSRIGEEKFPQERRSRDWGNENFPRSGEAATGEIFLHHDC